LIRSVGPHHRGQAIHDRNPHAKVGANPFVLGLPGPLQFFKRGAIDGRGDCHSEPQATLVCFTSTSIAIPSSNEFPREARSSTKKSSAKREGIHYRGTESAKSRNSFKFGVTEARNGRIATKTLYSRQKQPG